MGGCTLCGRRRRDGRGPRRHLRRGADEEDGDPKQRSAGLGALRPAAGQVARRHPHLLQGRRRVRHPGGRHRAEGADAAPVRAGDAQERAAERPAGRHADGAQGPHPGADQGDGPRWSSRAVVEEVKKKLEQRLRQAVLGALNRREHSPLPQRRGHRLEVDHRPQPEELQRRASARSSRSGSTSTAGRSGRTPGP